MDKGTKDALFGKKDDLYPEARAKRRKINKKILKFGCLPIVIFIIVVIILLSIGSNNSQKKALHSVNVSYKIISEKAHVNLKYGINKCNIDIRLQHKINKDQLKSIALKLRASRKTYRYLWIFYYLPNMKVGSGAWATTHFSPKLKVKIIGSTQSQEQNELKELKEIKGNIIGKWKENQYTSSIYLIYKDGNDYILRTIYPNSQISENKLTRKSVKDKVRYDYANGEYNGEYFMINQKGILEFYNRNGKEFTKALPLK